MTIEVFLDTTADPAVTVSPQHKDKDKGKDTITWKPGKDQDFTFDSLVFDSTPNPFGQPDVKDHKITASDDNSGGNSVGYFAYTIKVKLNGTVYSSKKNNPTGEPSDPMIHNLP